MPGTSNHHFRAIGLLKKYDGRAVVDGISLDVQSGEVVGLLGPNGAGKTTSFLDAEDLSGMPMYQRARRGIGYLPQEPSIFRKLTVRQNLRAVLEIQELTPGEVEQRVEELLDEYNLKSFADREGTRLSGGQRRRAEIARSIAAAPKFLLFDEPFAGIDPIAIIELKKMLKYLRDRGLGILITDHNVRETLSITDRAYIISEGGILDEGLPHKLVANPKVKDVYLGEEFTL
jgi:lipopolysaccharide export system ATP-binding protein